MSDIAHWLSQNGLEKYVSVFSEAEIELADLKHLTDDDLKELGLPMGPRRRAIDAIGRVSGGSKSQPSEPEVTAAKQSDADRVSAALSTDAERRHLTVMFVDLVGSTEMATQMDVEDMRDVITSYQNTVAGVVSRYGGFVAKFMGDGVLCYFGWPRANEDDAERAVRAGLSIIEAVKKSKTPNGSLLSTRVGIATGVVIVGDLIGSGATQEAAVVGETPNLAARLQGIAGLNQLVVAKETQQLLGTLFDLTLLDGQNLKGISGPVDAYRVEGEAIVQSRFAARQSGAMTPMVGREREIELMTASWSLARTGQGQMVVVSGEAGIGKSRITQAVIDEAANDNHTRISYQCSPYHTDSAFYPIIQQMSFAADFASSNSPDVRLDKLETLLGADQDTLRLVAALLGLDGAPRYGAVDLTPAQQRARTMQALVSLLVRLAREKPALMVFEDLHWIDPTSLELLDLLLDEITDQPIMILATARPTFDHGFGGHPIVTRFALNRLGKDQIHDVVSKLTDGKALPDKIMQIIAQRTDGVPLFVEELTKTILESGALKERGDRLVLNGPLNAIAIPATLHDSLMARLDRVHSIREVAQTAAGIGREFGYRLLASVSPLPGPELTAALDQLVAAELIFKRGVPPESTYTFKHALVRDAAYESLLKARRLAIHSAILTELQKQQDVAPELLAYHANQAGRLAEAAKYWELAGDQAYDRPALSEAGSHFERAVQCLRSLRKNVDQPDNPLRELDLRVKLSHVAGAVHGMPHSITADANAAARALLDSVGETPHRFPVLFNDFLLKLVRSQHSSALADADAMCDEAERSTDRVQSLIALRARGICQIIMGDLGAGGATLEQAFTHYDPIQDTQLARTYGIDPVAGLQIYRAISSLLRGEAQLAWDSVVNVEETARERGHVASYGFALGLLALLNQFGRKAGVYHRLNQLLTEVSDQHSLSQWRMVATLFNGAWLNDEKRYAESVQQLGAALEQMYERCSLMWIPHHQAIHAYSLAALGRFDEACESERKATDMIEQGSEQWTAAEVYRLIADADYWHRGEADKAIQGLQHAIGIAKGQGAKLWELRSTVSLARIFGDQGERGKGLAFLTSVVEDFPVGGRDLADMAEAVTLLQELT